MTLLDKSTDYIKRFDLKSTGGRLVVLILLAIGFRLWRINVDLPYIFQSDGHLNLVNTQNMLRNSDPNP